MVINLAVFLKIPSADIFNKKEEQKYAHLSNLKIIKSFKNGHTKKVAFNFYSTRFLT